MKLFFRIFIWLGLFFVAIMVQAQTNSITITTTHEGSKLMVNGQPFMINGMNWDYFPIGKNYEYSIWEQPDTIIKRALDEEMNLLKKMNVNAIRQYTGVPPKWITYIYENYGIYTMLNHSFGRYGVSIQGEWQANTDYGNKMVEEQLLKEVANMAKTYRNTPGLLLFLLGNENNYGLFWEGSETEDIPEHDAEARKKAEAMYKLFNKGVITIKENNNNYPVAICNGDLLFMDLIVELVPDADIFGTNVYRGASFGDVFERVKQEYKKPVLFTEFGSDAYNMLSKTTADKEQAYYLVNNWKEIYKNAAGLGLAENCIGGFTFQFSDGWWKFGQTKHLAIHDTNASWANGGYSFDYVEGENNMNEEWFGIVAKGEANQLGLYPVYPRAAYYALRKVHELNPYKKRISLQKIDNYFHKISLQKAVNIAECNLKKIAKE